MGFTERVRVALGKPDVWEFTLLDKCRQRLHHLFNGDPAIYPRRLEEVDFLDWPKGLLNIVDAVSETLWPGERQVWALKQQIVGTTHEQSGARSRIAPFTDKKVLSAYSGYLA
jgi:hypothetical protein